MALTLYALNLIAVFLLGRLVFKVLPGEPTGLIMEIPDYRLPHLESVLKQTWFRLLEFLKIALPAMIVSTILIKLVEMLGFLNIIASFLSPITVTWLGLPAITGVALIFGVLRKELTVTMLASLLGTVDFLQALTSIQMVVSH